MASATAKTLAGGLLVPILLSGCCGAVRIPAVPLEDPAALVRALDQAPQPRTLLFDARAEYYSARGARKGKVLILAETPDRIRVETLSLTDDMLSLLAVAGEEFVFFERGQPRCVIGRPCPENVARFLPIPLSVPDVIGVLSGRIPRKGSPDPGLRLDRRTGLYVLTLRSAEGETEQELRVDPFDFSVRSVRIRGPERTIRIDLSEFEEQGPYLLPHRIRIRISEPETDLSLDVREAQADVAFSGIPFTPTCPGQSIVERSLCPGENLEVPE